ncbi:MAG: tetratricopeptide repeat protein [Candidatus Competibacter sp.]|nr:tetratricopeptide repeat protein [Candidatus Competibacter sp.]MDG4582462.1 tetratricopeptide repeat protein [Candidatus Competibacter sp.]
MNKGFQSSLGMLALALALGTVGCAPPPYSQQPYRAPVVNRSTRPPQTYAQPRPVPPAATGRAFEQDPLLPREYSSSYPAAPDPYTTPPANPNAYYGSVPAQPYAPESGGGSYQQPPTYPPSGGSYQQPPAYPPSGGSYQQPSAYPPGGGSYQQPPAYPPGASASSPAYPAYPAPRADDYGRAAPPPEPVYPSSQRGTDDLYETAPSSGLLPEPQPVVPQTPPVAPARPVPVAPSPPPAPESTVAMATPPVAPAAPAAPVQAMPAPAAPAAPAPPPARPTPPADLPPAEITREGNQAVVALLDSADKYVRSKQLDKAGAALERALRIEPRNAGIWYDLAQIRLHQGEYQQAESLASKSNNLASGNRALQARNWKLIAVARKATGNTAGAEEAEAQASQLR